MFLKSKTAKGKKSGIASIIAAKMKSAVSGASDDDGDEAPEEDMAPQKFGAKKKKATSGPTPNFMSKFGK